MTLSAWRPRSAFTSYKDEVLEQMVGAVRCAARGRVVDPARLAEDLLFAIYRTGTAHDGSARMLVAQEVAGSEPDHKELERLFRRLAKAPNPLDPALLSNAAVRRELDRLIYDRWSPRWRRGGRGARATLADLDWNGLAREEKAEIRAMARHLEDWHRSNSPARRPNKDDINTLLILLADIFVQHAGIGMHPDELPHAQNSRFIQFAALALAPFFDASEVSRLALAHRWRRRRVRRPFSALKRLQRTHRTIRAAR
jgi:hypothetical protein